MWASFDPARPHIGSRCPFRVVCGRHLAAARRSHPAWRPASFLIVGNRAVTGSSVGQFTGIGVRVDVAVGTQTLGDISSYVTGPTPVTGGIFAVANANAFPARADTNSGRPVPLTITVDSTSVARLLGIFRESLDAWLAKKTDEFRPPTTAVQAEWLSQRRDSLSAETDRVGVASA
jgi:hypothetical protein